jgi:hypothetical protein
VQHRMLSICRETVTQTPPICWASRQQSSPDEKYRDVASRGDTRTDLESLASFRMRPSPHEPLGSTAAVRCCERTSAEPHGNLHPANANGGCSNHCHIMRTTMVQELKCHPSLHHLRPRRLRLHPPSLPPPRQLTGPVCRSAPSKSRLRAP